MLDRWSNVGPILDQPKKQISPTVALEAKTGQMSDAHLPSTALTKIGPIKSTLELHASWASDYFWRGLINVNIQIMTDHEDDRCDIVVKLIEMDITDFCSGP